MDRKYQLNEYSVARSQYRRARLVNIAFRAVALIALAIYVTTR